MHLHMISQIFSAKQCGFKRSAASLEPNRIGALAPRPLRTSFSGQSPNEILGRLASHRPIAFYPEVCQTPNACAPRFRLSHSSGRHRSLPCDGGFGRFNCGPLRHEILHRPLTVVPRSPLRLREVSCFNAVQQLSVLADNRTDPLRAVFVPHPQAPDQAPIAFHACERFRIISDAINRLVKVLVYPEHAVDPSGCNRVFEAGFNGKQSKDIARLDPLDAAPYQHHVDSSPHIVNVTDETFVDSSNLGTAIGLDNYQSLALQCLESLPHWHLAQAITLAELGDFEVRSRRKYSGQNLFAKAFADAHVRWFCQTVFARKCINQEASLLPMRNHISAHHFDQIDYIIDFSCGVHFPQAIQRHLPRSVKGSMSTFSGKLGCPIAGGWGSGCGWHFSSIDLTANFQCGALSAQNRTRSQQYRNQTSRYRAGG